MKRVLLSLVGFMALIALAGGLTELTFGAGNLGRISDDRKVAAPTASPTPKPTPSPSATPIATPVPTPPPAAIATPLTATTKSFVHMRTGASTSTAIVADLNGGTVVNLGAYSDSQWQQVSVNGTNGYIFKSYLSY